MRTQPAAREEGEVARRRWRLETLDPDDAPVEPPFADPDDPELIPDEEEDYPLPGEEEEYASPAVEPHEEPLVAP